MTARQVFEGMLTELSKVNAPSLLLQDFNYFFNKAINQYINKRYNIYDVNQQTTDDIRVLKSTAILDPVEAASYSTLGSGATSYLSQANSKIANLYGATYEVDLPEDYLHILNCICIYKVTKQFKCYDKDSLVQFAAKRLTSDSWSNIINDYFNRPLPERPYYFIHNVNPSKTLPTDPMDPETGIGTDLHAKYQVTPSAPESSNFPRTINLSEAVDETASTVEKDIAVRIGNPSKVRMEIRYGKDNTVFKLQKVLIDYVKVPQYIRLTQEQLDLTEDTSQIMEFPDYVCQEIINELVHIVMENAADPRLQSHIPVSQSIANPAQAQAQPQAQQA